MQYSMQRITSIQYSFRICENLGEPYILPTKGLHANNWHTVCIILGQSVASTYHNCVRLSMYTSI